MWENPGDLLFQLRIVKGWTLAQAERASDLAGSYISRIERGKHIPTREAVDKLVDGYAPHADSGLRDAVALAFGHPANPPWPAGISREAQSLAHGIFPVGLDPTGLRLLAEALGLPWPDTEAWNGRGAEWPVWTLLVWAAAPQRSPVAWEAVRAALRNPNVDGEYLIAALRDLPIPGIAPISERDRVAEEQLLAYWHQLSLFQRNSVLAVARAWAEQAKAPKDPGRYDYDAAPTEAELNEVLPKRSTGEALLGDLPPDVRDALNTIMAHLRSRASGS